MRGPLQSPPLNKVPDEPGALTTAASTNFAEYFGLRDHLRPFLCASAQTCLMKPYIRHQLFRAHTSARTRQLSANKVGQTALRNKYKKCKSVHCWIYTDTWMLSKIDFSPSSFFLPLLPFSLCVPVCQCTSVFLLRKTLILQTSAQGY